MRESKYLFMVYEVYPSGDSRRDTVVAVFTSAKAAEAEADRLNNLTTEDSPVYVVNGCEAAYMNAEIFLNEPATL